MRPGRKVLLAGAVATVFLCGPKLYAQEPANETKPPAATASPKVEERLVKRLPEDWRATALRFHVFSDADTGLADTPNVADEDIRLTALQRLIGIPGAEDFSAKHLQTEIEQIHATGHALPEANLRDVLSNYLESIGYHRNWAHNPLAVPLLENEAYTDPDPKLSLAALRALHRLEVKRLLETVDIRLGDVSYDYKNHKEQVDELEAEQETLLYQRDGIDLPEVMRNPPPLFRVPTKSNSIRVAMMGDFGTRGEDQHRVAAAMVEENKKIPFDFGLTLGDNFYFQLTSADDPQLKVAFEDLYGRMGITFYPCFGNHDWGGELPVIELQYSAKNPHWNFPAPYYTYTAGPVQFFVVNTEFQFDRPDGLYAGVDGVELRWLQTELEKSKATWKVVYGHIPAFTSTYVDNGPMQDLMAILKGRADFYIAGHVHNLEQHKPVGKVNLFIIGASGRGEVPVDASDPDTIFAKEAYGFGVLEANDHDLTIRILGEDDKEIHTATFHK